VFFDEPQQVGPNRRSEGEFMTRCQNRSVTHLLRLIEKHISFAFVRERLKASYSDTGRPSIDPSSCCAFC